MEDAESRMREVGVKPEGGANHFTRYIGKARRVAVAGQRLASFLEAQATSDLRLHQQHPTHDVWIRACIAIYRKYYHHRQHAS